MIDELDNRVRNMEYINSQEFICDLLRTVDYSKDEIDENKRIMYAKYLTSNPQPIGFSGILLAKRGGVI